MHTFQNTSFKISIFIHPPIYILHIQNKIIHLSMKLKGMWGLLLMFCLLRVALCDDASLEYKCSNEITKLTNCLDFATGKSSEPAGSCCGSVSDIRQRDAVCLCFIIQQTHDGSSGFKGLGLQFLRMLALPGVCKIANSSITECPKLLNISPSSPDYSIFNNTPQGASTTSGSTTTTTTTTTTTSSSPMSNGALHRICVHATVSISLISSMFFSIF